jgi:hypothetical protein
MTYLQATVAAWCPCYSVLCINSLAVESHSRLRCQFRQVIVPNTVDIHMGGRCACGTVVDASITISMGGDTGESTAQPSPSPSMVDLCANIRVDITKMQASLLAGAAAIQGSNAT